MESKLNKLSHRPAHNFFIHSNMVYCSLFLGYYCIINNCHSAVIIQKLV